MFSLRSVYFIWLFIHITAIIFSGWFGKITIYKGASWSELIGYQSKFWPVQTLNLAHYDITEFIIYYAILPFIVYRFMDKYYFWEKY
ncbi:MAG TPA: hypothetical protein VLN45_09235 [Ignavibacteriaceae bacterium]|nr:hypothetical protein [Ignavibacteriaceae bacterium]